MRNIWSAFCWLRFFRHGYRCSVMSLAWYIFHSVWSISSRRGLKLSSASNSDSHKESSQSWYWSWNSQRIAPFLPGVSWRRVGVYRSVVAVEIYSSPSLTSHACCQNLFSMGCLRRYGLLRKVLTAATDTCLGTSCTTFHCHFQAGAGLSDGAYRPWASQFLVDQFRSPPSQWKLLLVSRTSTRSPSFALIPRASLSISLSRFSRAR